MAKPYRAPELVTAVLGGRTHEITQALATAADVDERDTHQRTALMHATIKGDLSTLTRLLERGADPVARDYIGWTALHYAIYGLHVELVASLLATGIDVRIDSLGYHNADRVPPTELRTHAKAIVQQLCKADGHHPEGVTAPLAPTSVKLRIAGQKVSMNMLARGDYSLAPSKPKPVGRKRAPLKR